MDRAEAEQIASDYFAEAAPAEAILVSSRLLRKKKIASTATRRLARLKTAIRDALAGDDVDKARGVAQAFQWNGPPMLWWCDDVAALADVIELLAVNPDTGKIRTFAYDIRFPHPRVAEMEAWKD
jgi:hypothetical protein